MKTLFSALLFLSLIAVSCSKSTPGTESQPGENPPVAPPVTPPPTPPLGNPVAYGVNKDVMLQLINNVRAQGCNCGNVAMPPVAPLTWNDQLSKAAYNHSNDMFTNNFFSHTGTGNTNVGQRVTAQGYTWQTVGENIALGNHTEQSVMNAWLNSPGHCSNIMYSGFKDVGFGKQGNYWTQVFAARP
jgi:uncharacterized protein YkwD